MAGALDVDVRSLTWRQKRDLVREAKDALKQVHRALDDALNTPLPRATPRELEEELSGERAPPRRGR